MSHIFHKLAIISRGSNKPNKSASNTNQAQSWTVGDSRLHLSHCITNTTGTFSGFINHPLILVLSVSLLSTTLLFYCSDTYATSSSLTVSVSSGSGAYVNIPPTAEGKFGATGATTFNVTTTHASGYTLTASATDLSFTDTEGTNGTENAVYTIDNLVLPTGTTSISAADFADSTNTDYKNKWGYMPSRYYNASTSSTVTDNTNYFPAPINATQTLDVTNDATNNDYDIVVGTKLDHTVALGSYTTTITLTAVANPTPYTINYLANDGADGANTANMPSSPQTGSIDGDNVALAPNAPVRNNYFFNGWCTVATSVDSSCSGTTYYGNDTYDIDQTSSNNELNLYAMWNTSTCAGKTNLHDLVTCQVKTTDNTERTQTLSDMQAVITGPITGDPSTDTSNSGVYLYDADYYGKANDNPDDTLNTEDIYYFRGVLDSTYTTTDQYGGIPSTGDGAYYHNYVRLSDTSNGRSSTCWRIVRTTATGGTKMIYNGVWDNTNHTCANERSNAAATNTYYNRGRPSDYGNDSYGTDGFVVYIGYNYNSKYAYNNTQYDTALNNSELFNNETPSNIRMQTEKWYTDNSNLVEYMANAKLEASAGWCNDRTTQDSPSSTNTTTPYKTSNDWVSFGPSFRNTSFDRKLSLTCPNITGFDLLTPPDGLSHPLALLTRDETSLVGHGRSDGDDSPNPSVVTRLSSNYSFDSYLRSGNSFWLLSPYTRNIGSINNAQVVNDGRVRYARNIWGADVRPTISLASSTTITSGTGTSTDPWVIEP